MPVPGVSPYSPPTWITEFGQAMAWSDRDQRWSDADVLDLIAAAADLNAWLHDPRPYAWRHKHAWGSAIADLHAAADLIGPRLAAALGRHLTAALAATSALPGDNPTPARPAAQAALAALRARWADPMVVEAAWSDIADACRDSATPFETIAARRDVFWRLIRTADRNAPELSGALTGVLHDRAVDVMAARVVLGDIPDPGSAGWPRPAEPCGLSDADRMDLGRRLLAAPTTSAHHVVWVAFDRASLVGTVETVGPITFYDGRWVRESLEHKGPHLSQLPSELTNRDSWVSHNDLPDGSHIVLARVDLGTGALPDAPRVAAEQARAIVAVASFHAGDRHWQALNGYLHAVDGVVVGWSLFHDPLTEISDIRANLHLTGGELARVAGTLGSQLPVTSPALTEAIEALHWWQDTQDRTPLVAVGLDVRVVELVASRVLANAPAKRRTWYNYLDDYLAIAWMVEHIRDELHRVVFHALHNYRRQNVDPKEDGALGALEVAVITYGAGRRYDFRLDQALAALSTLATIYPVHDRLGRRIHTLASHLASPSALDAWCHALQHRWDRTLARLRRERDAITHGGPITTDAISTVHRFGRRVAGWALSLSLEGLLDGTGDVARHVALRARDKAWRAGVPSAPSVNDALFRP